jgi:hypothetical protein
VMRYKEQVFQNSLRRFLLLGLTVFLCGQTVAGNLAVSDFQHQGLNGWEAVKFNDETHYEIVELDNKKVVRAVSQDSASGMLKRMHVDLRKTPYLNWSWKVEKPLTGLDETTRKGDDYVARVYVVIKGGIFFWQTKALIYAWTGGQREGALWPNAYTSNSQMMSAEFGSDNAGKWIKEKHNVYEGLKRAFGEQFDSIDAVAFMTDTDNSDKLATAYYGEIFFSDQ